MGFLLHEKATVVCLHTGQAEPATTDQRVKVSGQKIVTKPMMYKISGCILPSPPNGNGPCVTATWLSAALRVKASGQAVLLKESRATCAPTSTGLNIMQTQTRVKGQ